jgi:hypothetical protein
MRLVLLVLVSLLAPPAASAARNSEHGSARERGHLSQAWSDYRHTREKKKSDFRACREKATSERIAANLRAEFVHDCVRERRKSESAFGAKADLARRASPTGAMSVSRTFRSFQPIRRCGLIDDSPSHNLGSLMNENSFANTNARLRVDSCKQTFSNRGLHTYL